MDSEMNESASKIMHNMGNFGSTPSYSLRAMKRAEENTSNSSKKNFATIPYDGFETTNLILGGGIPKTQPKSLANKYASLMKETKSSAMRKGVQNDPNYVTNSPKKSPKKKSSPSPLAKSKTSVHLNNKGMVINLKQTPSKDDDRLF
jgi:hypothetical protein